MKKILPAVILVLFVVLLCASASSDPILQVPAGTKAIASETFFGDRSLDTVILPEGLESIGSKAFAKSSVRLIFLPESVNHIESDAFSGCTVVGYGKKDGTYAANFFSSHSGLQYVREASANLFTYESAGEKTCLISGYTGNIGNILLPRTAPDGKKVTGIYWQAFSDNSVVKKVAIPEGYTEIQTNAFYRCTNLTWVGLPASLRKIGAAVFYYCDNLYSVELPDNITEAEEWEAAAIPFASVGSDTAKALGKAGSCFRVHGCDADLRYMYYRDTILDLALTMADPDIVSCTVPEGVTTIGYKGQVYCKGFRQCYDLETVKLPKSLKRIDKEAFYFCSSLQYVVLPGNVQSIGESAFARCTSMKSIVFSTVLESIDKNAFDTCTALKTVTITQNVTTIRANAFSHSGVETFWIVAENLTVFYPDALSTPSLITIYCYPDTATWNTLYPRYSEYMQPYNAVG